MSELIELAAELQALGFEVRLMGSAFIMVAVKPTTHLHRKLFVNVLPGGMSAAEIGEKVIASTRRARGFAVEEPKPTL